MSTTNEVQSIINCQDVQQANVVLLAVSYDGASSFGKGAEGGPTAIRKNLDRQIELRNWRTGTTPELKIAWCEVPVTNPVAMYRETNFVRPEKIVSLVAGVYRRCLERGQFPILLPSECGRRSSTTTSRKK